MTVLEQSETPREAIVRLLAAYAEQIEKLSRHEGLVTVARRAALRDGFPGLRDALADAEWHEQELLELAEDHPELFERPRSIAHEDVSVGLHKAADRVEPVESGIDAAALEARLKTVFPDGEPAGLATRTVTLSVAGVRALSAEQRAALGVRLAVGADKARVKSGREAMRRRAAAAVQEGEALGLDASGAGA